MSKQEMAEWLAKEVLGFHLELFPGCETAKQWHRKGEHICYEGELEDFIYSPDGFFSVREKVFKGTMERDGLQIYRSWPIFDEGGEGIKIMISEDDTKATQYDGKSYTHDIIQAEIEAFYNAVKEAWSE